MRTKEFLSARGVDYESINVAEDDEGMEALRSLGARGVPVVSRDNEFIYSQDLNELARFVGIDYRTEPELAPGELIERYIRILDVARKGAQQIPANNLNDKLPGRDRTIIALVNHIVEIAAGFVRVTRGEDFTGAVAEAVPDRERGPDELDEFAAGIQRQLQAWWQGPGDHGCEAMINTFYGPQSLHALLERCTWHSTQHVRQLMMMLDTLGVTPEERLTAKDLQGLPLPDNVWDG